MWIKITNFFRYDSNRIFTKNDNITIKKNCTYCKYQRFVFQLKIKKNITNSIVEYVISNILFVFSFSSMISSSLIYNFRINRTYSTLFIIFAFSFNEQTIFCKAIINVFRFFKCKIYNFRFFFSFCFRFYNFILKFFYLFFESFEFQIWRKKDKKTKKRFHLNVLLRKRRKRRRKRSYVIIFTVWYLDSSI